MLFSTFNIFNMIGSSDLCYLYIGGWETAGDLALQLSSTCSSPCQNIALIFLSGIEVHFSVYLYSIEHREKLWHTVVEIILRRWARAWDHTNQEGINWCNFAYHCTFAVCMNHPTQLQYQFRTKIVALVIFRGPRVKFDRARISPRSPVSSLIRLSFADLHTSRDPCTVVSLSLSLPPLYLSLHILALCNRHSIARRSMLFYSTWFKWDNSSSSKKGYLAFKFNKKICKKIRIIYHILTEGWKCMLLMVFIDIS